MTILDHKNSWQRSVGAPIVRYSYLESRRAIVAQAPPPVPASPSTSCRRRWLLQSVHQPSTVIMHDKLLRNVFFTLTKRNAQLDRRQQWQAVIRFITTICHCFEKGLPMWIQSHEESF